MNDNDKLHQALPEAYMVERSAEEVRQLLHWTAEQMNAPEPSEFALGVWTTILWLSGSRDIANPADYKGPFTINNILIQAEALENLRNRSRTQADELIRKTFG